MNKFGQLINGTDVFEYTISNSHGMSLSAINYGGRITKLFVPDENGNIRNVVLGYNSLNEYVNDPFYIGALIGRCANRISNSKFSINGKEYSVTQNQGRNHLHGGKTGFHAVYWNITKKHTSKGQALELSYISEDGEDGYPGTMQVRVVYILTEKNEVQIDYRAQTSESTIANFTQHSYFNLTGDKEIPITDHTLTLYSSLFLPVKCDGIPTGEILPVTELCKASGTVNEMLASNSKHIDLCNGIDHCCLVPMKRGIQKVVTLHAKQSGINMTVETTQPAFQCYSGNFLENQFLKHAGICIETQGYTNAVNEPDFPSVILNPGEEYIQKSVWRFGIVKM